MSDGGKLVVNFTKWRRSARKDAVDTLTITRCVHSWVSQRVGFEIESFCKKCHATRTTEVEFTAFQRWQCRHQHYGPFTQVGPRVKSNLGLSDLAQHRCDWCGEYQDVYFPVEDSL